MSIKNIEDFVREYQSFVKDWFTYNNWARLEFNSFWHNFLLKITKNNDLDKYNENHESTAQFNTWLKTVLKYFYIDQWRKLQTKSSSLTDKYESLDSDGSEYEKARVYNLRKEVQKAEEDVRIDIDWNKVSKLMDEIENDKFRVIVKLKLFHQKYFPLNNKDYIYIEKMSDLSREKIEEFLLENQKQPFGMKNKDVSSLLGIPEGTISTTYKRVVREFVELPYKKLSA
jgi:DNA-directed RNA polymerase specialized sigma24 family protein